MNNQDYRKFLSRQYQRQRKHQGRAVMSADRVKRQQQRNEIDAWARKVQAEN